MPMPNVMLQVCAGYVGQLRNSFQGARQRKHISVSLSDTRWACFENCPFDCIWPVPWSGMRSLKQRRHCCTPYGVCCPLCPLLSLCFSDFTASVPLCFTLRQC